MNEKRRSFMKYDRGAEPPVERELLKCLGHLVGQVLRLHAHLQPIGEIE